ncbi:hypothetical protein Tco_1491173 [Tanacetum coccineum]
MRMEQYLTFTDHALWEVIVNGDSVSPVASASTGAKGPIPPKTAEQKLARKNELKPKSTLMLAIPDENLLKFHAYKDEKSLWEAIKNSQEGLDKTYDRFQKLISQLEIHGKFISQEDANLKLLRSLPSAWNNIALIMRNKSDLNTLSMDDLYNNLKVITNETDNTAHSVSAASFKDQASTISYADDVMVSFFANQSNAPQLDSEDLEQIDADDHEEMDLKWVPRNQGNRNRDDPRRNAPLDTSTANALVVQDGIGYQMGLESLEARIVFHEKNEAVYEEDIAFLNQITTKDKTGLGFDEQVNEDEVLYNVFDSRESDGDDNLVNDRFKKVEGYYAVPPPYTGNYMPSRPDSSFAGLDDSFYNTKVSETITTASKTSKDSLEKTKTVRLSAPIIEKYDTDSDNDSMFRPKTDQTKPKFTKINIVKSEKPVLNNKGMVTGQREIRPVWNNAQRMNHQNKLTHPHPKRNFVPTAVATKPKAVVSAAEGNRENAVKSSACWIWRPSGNVIDHNSKDSGSYMLKRFNYVDLQGRLKHMTRNKFFLIDYQDIDGGFVAFGGSPKGGKITGKGKFRNGKLDFEDVYFVKELKFNLFSVSQMCGKKNSVLFTETECLVLSPDFKLLDES